MSQEARISTRIDPMLKSQAEMILSELGIKSSQAITMFYKQIVNQRGIPLELKIPNEQTLAAMNEDMSQATRHTSVKSLFAELDE